MDSWSNIETSGQDSEITEVNKLENALGAIPPAVMNIRELITRFEVCHFKYLQHLMHIQVSIFNLDPTTNSGNIGSNHISKGENAWINDKTGRSLLGQQYLWGLNNWLSKADNGKIQKDHDPGLESNIVQWLGDKTTDKERIVRLLIARLTYNWETYEKLQPGEQFKELELQACKMDICHYAFPDNLNSLIQAIGKMQSHKDLEGCGSFNSEIKMVITRKYSDIVSTISGIIKSKSFSFINHNDQFRIWLNLCLAKTIKEQTGITNPLPTIENIA